MAKAYWRLRRDSGTHGRGLHTWEPGETVEVGTLKDVDADPTKKMMTLEEIKKFKDKFEYVSDEPTSSDQVLDVAGIKAQAEAAVREQAKSEAEAAVKAEMDKLRAELEAAKKTGTATAQQPGQQPGR